MKGLQKKQKINKKVNKLNEKTLETATNTIKVILHKTECKRHVAATSLFLALAHA